MLYVNQLAWRYFTVRNNKILDGHEEGTCELSSGPVPRGWVLFFILLPRRVSG